MQEIESAIKQAAQMLDNKLSVQLQAVSDANRAEIQRVFGSLLEVMKKPKEPEIEKV